MLTTTNKPTILPLISKLSSHKIADYFYAALHFFITLYYSEQNSVFSFSLDININYGITTTLQ